MSVYKKLAEARAKLQEVDINKSGRNSYSNFSYFELSDFLPHINRINQEVGIVSIISFTEGQATLEIIDVEDESKVILTTPTSKQALKNASEIQQIGACHTYFRRYLYLLAYEICEHDVVDRASQETPEAKEEIALNLSAPAVKKEVSPSDVATAIQTLDKASSGDDLRKLFASLKPELQQHQEIKDFGNSKRSQLLNVKQASETKVSINPNVLIKQSQA